MKNCSILFAAAAAVICGFAATFSESANAVPRAVCSDVEEIDSSNSSSGLSCEQIDGVFPVIGEETSYGSDAPMVVAVWSFTSINGIVGVGTDDEQLLVIANRTDEDIVYSPDSPLVFYPKDAGFSPLTLAGLVSATTIPAMMQEALRISVALADFVINADGNGTGTQYWSMPAAALTEGENGICPGGINDLQNDCLPLTDDICRMMDPPQMLDAADMCRLPNSDAECDDLDSTKPIFDAAASGNCRAAAETPGNGGGMTPTMTVTEASAKRDDRDFPVVGAIVMGLLIFGLSDGGEEGEFSTSPSFGYSVNESGYSANVGGRMDFRKDEWTLFYTGGQTNANGEFGEFRYASGGEYKTDFWKAAFSESVSGERADYDLSLSADMSGGIWSLSPVYRMYSRLEEGESATRNSLNLEGVLEYERWTIRQSAGFGWRRADEFGDSAKFRLEAVREF